MRKMNKKQVVILVLYSIVLLLGHNFYSYAYNHPAEVLFLSELCFLYPISQTFHLYIIFMIQRLFGWMFLYQGINVFITRLSPYYVVRGYTARKLLWSLQIQLFRKVLIISSDSLLIMLMTFKEHNWLECIAVTGVYGMIQLVETVAILVIGLLSDNRNELAIFEIVFVVALFFICETFRKTLFNPYTLFDTQMLFIIAIGLMAYVSLSILSVHLLKRKEY